MTTVRELKDRIREIVATVLETGGFELVEVEVGGLGSRTIVKVLADRPGGILLEECAAISRQLSPLLDNADLIPHRYTLEVSSPGLGRPLVTERDFRRRIGELIKVHHLKVDGKETESQGKLLDCEEEKILIETEAGIQTVSLSAIKKAKVLIL